MPTDHALDTVPLLLERNARFAEHEFPGFTPIAPALRTIVVGCVDPRVDPARVLGLTTGDAVVIRNVGGRITPGLLQQMVMLRSVAQADGDTPGPGWNFVVLHHTDCGITRLEQHTHALAGYFGVEPDEVPACTVTDPYAAVAIDVAALKANPFLPAEFLVSGLVYDVETGRVATVVPPAPLREA